MGEMDSRVRMGSVDLLDSVRSRVAMIDQSLWRSSSVIVWVIFRRLSSVVSVMVRCFLLRASGSRRMLWWSR